MLHLFPKMNHSTALVITSIAGQDNPVLSSYASACKENGVRFIVVGDTKSPATFQLEGCDFFSLEQQRKSGFSLAVDLPEKHYGRKNLGYLEAIRNGAQLIIETDDDNYPRPEFWSDRRQQIDATSVVQGGWVNVYAYFTSERIWPRGFALEHLQDQVPDLNKFNIDSINAPIQQGLADDNPDVDAIYRLALPLPLKFNNGKEIALGRDSWCPFNSQNTTWFKEAFPLLYLPSYCSFRMTDIWRSFIAQRIAWENNWSVVFHRATVYQERNMHNLMRDFSDEIPGYLNNKKLTDTLLSLHLKPGKDAIGENLVTCYESLVSIGLIGEKELPLLHAWLHDLKSLNS